MRRYFQFRLGTMLLFVAAVALGLGWIAYARDQAKKRQAAIEANEQATEKLKDDIAYSEGFRMGVAEAIEEQKIGVSSISCFIPRTSTDQAKIKGYREGIDLVNKALLELELDRLEQDSPGAKEKHKQGLERMVRAISEHDKREKLSPAP